MFSSKNTNSNSSSRSAGSESSSARVKWLSLGLFLIFGLSLALRLWQLDRLNTLIFDEVYFAKYGFNYVKSQPLFDVHPPFGKYFIALGIWLHAHLFGGAESLSQAAEVSQLNPFAYRWANAVTGSLVPILVGAIALQLTHRLRYALLTTGLVALDGLLLVESRLSLINVYLLFFGLLGLWCFLRALSQRNLEWLIGAGVAWGACASVKWNGLGFLLGAYCLYAVAWGLEELKAWRATSESSGSEEADAKETATYRLSATDTAKNPLRSLFEFDLWQLGFALGIVPFIVYRLQWIPHLQLNPNFTFLEMQRQILGYHENIGNTTADHPYCSPWYTWMWMKRPVGYYFETIEVNGQTTVSDIHAFGNPLLWWFSSIAILFLIASLLRSLYDWFLGQAIAPDAFWLKSVLACQYAANFLPWAKVSRCTYIYHYMGASLFAFMALAWWIDRGVSQSRPWLRVLSWSILGLIVVGFLFWMPIYMGLPLSRSAFDARMWFRSWY